MSTQDDSIVSTGTANAKEEATPRSTPAEKAEHVDKKAKQESGVTTKEPVTEVQPLKSSDEIDYENDTQVRNMTFRKLLWV